MKYKVGDKVRIVSEWGEGCCQNQKGGRWSVLWVLDGNKKTAE